MLTPRGPVLIDWCNAAEGPPDFDLAVTAVILAQVAVGRADLAAPAAALLAAFLRYAGGDPLSDLDRAVALRGANPTMTPEEVAGLPAAAQLINELVISELARGSASLVGDEHG